MDAHELVTALKAAAEPTRLRMLFLLSRSELSVKDLTRILGQSQPRISRHLKLLTEAGLIARVREGSWAYFHLVDSARTGWLGRVLAEAVTPADNLVARDVVRAEALKQERVEAAQAFFRSHAGRWDSIRSLHVDETVVEGAMVAALGQGPFELLIDLGTGTGRMLELFAGCYRRAVGIDASTSMLSYARSKLDRSPMPQVQVRQGDIYNLNVDDRTANAVVMHQVLHYLTDPRRAIHEAARILAPGGKLLVVDFAPHDLEFLREDFAHVRLGFARAEMEQWLREAGLALHEVQDLVPPVAAGLAGEAEGGREEGRAMLTVSLWLASRIAAGQHAPKGWSRMTVKENAT